MKLYTIGFTKKSAKEFFELLKFNNISKIIDIRLNNSSQLAGFAKAKDLKYFLDIICRIKYEHDISLAPTKELLNDYKKNKISWQQYEKKFNKLLDDRRVLEKIDNRLESDYNGICLLCSEHNAEKCHRRIVAEYIKVNKPELDIEIVHL